MEGLANWVTRWSLYVQRRLAFVRGKCMAARSRMNREVHVRISERLR
jgi:hypothetical protein